MGVNVADVESESIVDGPGFRFAVYTQGCPHHCPGCHNPQTHAFTTQHDIEPGELVRLVHDSPLNAGVTLSGGEPFCQAAALVPFARAVRAEGKGVWAYSGYTFEQLQGTEPVEGAAAEHLDVAAARELLGLCDVLVDGPFKEGEQSYDLHWKGSRNQRVIDVPASLEAGEVVLYEQ